MSLPVAFVCAMPMELAPLVRSAGLTERGPGPVETVAGRVGAREVVAVVTGMGTALASAGVEALLGAVAVERVVVVGIAGALADDLPIGALLCPDRVVDGATGTAFVPELLGPATPRGTLWTSDSVITDAVALDELRGNGVVALDMETAAIAAVCSRHRVPWSVFRAVSDRVADGSVDDEVFHLSNQDGTPDGKAVAAYVLRHPGRIPALARMAKGSRLATERAASAAIAAVGALGAPPGNGSPPDGSR
jgi:adenosylhomocysteine nucleosidase